MPGAKYAFKSAFHNSTTNQIEFDRLKKIQNLRTLITWAKSDKFITLEHSMQEQLKCVS
jgi:2-hydroxy-6-oxonona-2,4-dienedioate hydrolase